MLTKGTFAFNGNGSMTTPYLIGNPSDLQQLAADVNGATPISYEGKYFELTHNIDLSSLNDWTPIGVDELHPFQGIFNGNGYLINGISITSDADNKGLFGFIDVAQIKNLGINGSVSGRTNVAAIAANAMNSSISNCYNNATVTASGDNAGGIVGVLYNTEITNCYNKGSITSNSGAGGIVGVVYKADEIYGLNTSGTINGISTINSGFEKLPYHYIPSKIGAVSIARLYDNFLKDNLYIQEIEIESGSLTNFHPYVLSGCKNLKKITINPTAGKNIGLGNYTLSNCTGLTGTFIIPECVTALGAAVMTGCSNIEELHISSNVASIGRAFLGMTKLTKLYLPRTSVTTLTSADAFGGSPNMVIYVPADLVESYKTATNWTKYADKFIAIP